MNESIRRVNRFPGEAGLNLETISFTPEGVAKAALPPTASLPQVLELQEYCGSYFQRIPARDKSQGRCYVVRGENGTGKTHALLDSMARAACATFDGGTYSFGGLSEGVIDKAQATKSKRPIVLYAKAGEGS